MLRIETLKLETHAAWDAYVEQHPLSTLYHDRAWQESAQRAYRMAAPFLVARRQGQDTLAGVLPLFVVKRPFGSCVIGGLYGAYGRLLADDEAVGEALLERAKQLTADTGCHYLQLKSLGDDPLCESMVRHDTSVTATLPLAASPDVMWKGFRDKIRNAIRKGQRANFEVRSGMAELEPYYDVLADNMHRKGSPIYGLRFMRELAIALGDRCEIICLYHDGQPVSAGFVAYHKDTVYVPFASSRASHFSMNPNNVLYWEVIQRACQRGMAKLDFGRSPKDSSTLSFKLFWGATTTTMPFYVHQVRGKPPVLEAGASVHRLVQLWQKLPRPVADAIGPAICRRWLV
jgi:FemAB-related protein (PEP-CTERM system-associated)